MFSIVHKATVLPPKIDKVSITYNPTSIGKDWSGYEECKALLTAMEFLEANHFAEKVWGGGYRYALCVVLNNGTLRLQINPIYQNAATFRCEFNPARLEMADVRAILDIVLPLGYSSLMNYGRCTRMDIAIDILGVDIEDMMVWNTAARRTRMYTGEYGCLETYYLGSLGSQRHFAIYDKRAEMEKNGIDMDLPDGPIVRIEARLRPSVYWCDMSELPNPFAKLNVASYASIGALDVETHLFLESCRLRGPQAALKRVKKLDASLWSKYSKRLEQHVSPWWDPEHIWARYPDLLHDLTYPSGVSAIGEKIRKAHYEQGFCPTSSVNVIL